MTAADLATLQPGDRVGRYVIVRHLATGGMAELYIARASGFEGVEQVVALKRVLSQFADDPTFVQMFLDETRVAATLQHHGVAQVLDFGRDGDTYFYTMELLRGHDLHKVSRGMARGQIAIDYAVATAIGMAVASALHYVHEKRDLTTNQPLCLVHRDVSPSNIVVTYDGGVKIVDFGIAKSVTQRTRTRANSIKGKLPYMSPEQCRALPVDRRTDVYALGAVLYEITTGTRAIAGATEQETAEAILAGRVTPVEQLRPGYPRALANCIRKAMAVDPSERYQTALELAFALEDVAASSRYLTSSISLAAWLQRAFGPPEDLVLGPASTSGPPSIAYEPVTETSATATANHVRPPPTVTASSTPRRRRWPLYALAAAASVGLAIAGVLIAARSRAAAPPASTPMASAEPPPTRDWPLAPPAALDPAIAERPAPSPPPPPTVKPKPKRTPTKQRKLPTTDTLRDSPFLPGVE